MEAIINRAAAERADTIRTFLEAIFSRYCTWRTACVLEDLDDRLKDDIGIRRETIPEVAARHGRRLWW